MSTQKARIAVIGGSGLCKLPELEVDNRVRPNTMYGLPSDEIILGRYGGVPIAFLPRHGPEHSIPPHRIPYMANIAALQSLGVNAILATCIAGSLRQEIEPGSFVVPSQFVNLTYGRDDNFDQDGLVVHTPMANPYCPTVSRVISEEANFLGIKVHQDKTVIVIQGPRFSTLAESSYFIRNGWDIVNMTQYPECYFARMLGICYGSIAMITDYDPGVRHELQMAPGKMEEILPIFHRNIELGKELLLKVLPALSDDRQTECDCTETYRDYYKK